MEGVAELLESVFCGVDPGVAGGGGGGDAGGGVVLVGFGFEELGVRAVAVGGAAGGIETVRAAGHGAETEAEGAADDVGVNMTGYTSFY